MTTPSVQNVPTFAQLASDPATPYWAKNLINTISRLDIVDVANVLELLATVASAQCDRSQRAYASRCALIAEIERGA